QRFLPPVSELHPPEHRGNRGGGAADRILRSREAPWRRACVCDRAAHHRWRRALLSLRAHAGRPHRIRRRARDSQRRRVVSVSVSGRAFSVPRGLDSEEGRVGVVSRASREASALLFVGGACDDRARRARVHARRGARVCGDVHRSSARGADDIELHRGDDQPRPDGARAMSGVDFIVLDIDGGAMLAACLDSIERQSVAPQRIIVLDNGGRTADRGKQAAGERMLWLRSETNLGCGGVVNHAFQHVTAPFVALINNDVVLDEDWLETVLAAMSDAKVAGVQTVIRRDAMTIDGAGVDIADGTYRQTLDPARAWGISATAALYRVSALGKRVFATRFFAYYEDVELSARLHEQGWETRVLPVIKAAHRGSQSAPLLGDRAL